MKIDKETKQEKKKFSKILGKNIAYYRHMRGMTLEDLSQDIGYTPAYINYIEHGKNTPSTFVIYKISQALNVPIEKIFKKDENQKLNLNIKNDPILKENNFEDYFKIIKKAYKNNIDPENIEYALDLLSKRMNNE